ncbi:MAG: hypothetical protein Q8M11_17875 [Sulfuritalea sp.]|nr:hypothetical protein [Sulfuritalea sp.]
MAPASQGVVLVAAGHRDGMGTFIVFSPLASYQFATAIMVCERSSKF